MTPTALEPMTHAYPMHIRRPRARVRTQGLDRRSVLAANTTDRPTVSVGQLTLFSV